MSKTKKNSTEDHPNFKVITSLRTRLHIPEEVRNILPEKGDYDGIDFGKLEVEVIKKTEFLLNKALVDYGSLKENPDESKLEEVTKMIFECLTCLKHLSDSKRSLSLLHIKFKGTLHNIINSEHESKIKNLVAMISEKIIEDCSDFEVEDDADWALSIYLWLLNAVEESDLNGCNPLVKRVAAMGKAVVKHSLPLPSVPLLKCVIDERYLKLKEGRQHLASLFSHSTMLPACHALVWEALPSLKSVAGTYYGEVYTMAWNQASASVRSTLELECFQKYIEQFLKLDRPGGTELSSTAKVIFNILNFLHYNRNSVQFSVALSKIYMPIIWRATKSDHPIVRCNAAQLLFDVFPMEKCQGNTVENHSYKEKQFKELMDLLMDECHYCRIVSIRSAARIISDVVTCLSSEQWNKLVYVLADDLANDGSSSLVRREVFLTLANVIHSDKCAPLLAPILPHLYNHFHDTNARVRKAFVQILLNVERSEKLSMSYTDVVPITHIVSRLSIEDSLVGKPLAKLIMPTFYYDGCNLREMVCRLQKLILMSQKAAENLFRYAKAALDVQQMQMVLIAILAHLRKIVKDKLGENEDEQNQDSYGETGEEGNKENSQQSEPRSPPRKINKKSLAAHDDSNSSNISQASVSSKSSNSAEQENLRELPSQNLIDCHTGLLICVQVGWQAFADELSEPQNKELLSNLYKITVASVQKFLMFYKDTPAFYATVALSALVPVTKISHETTVTSTCISELRNADLNTPCTQLKALIRALCEWNCGQDVIYLALDWFDSAFAHFNLNQSNFNVKRGKRKTKVRFIPITGKESLSLKILNILFTDFLNERKVIAKQYEAVKDLYSYLEQVQIIIESRFTNRKSVGDITDQFLLDCMDLVYKLLYALHKTPPGESEKPNPVNRDEEEEALEYISAPDSFIKLIDWGYKVVFPNLPKVSGDIEDMNLSDPEVLFPLKLMSGLIKGCNASIQMDLTSVNHVKASILLTNKLLESEWKCYFIEDGINLLKNALDYALAWLPNEKEDILCPGAPSLYSFLLVALRDTPPSLLSKCDVNMKSLKKDILSFPMIAMKKFGVTHINFTKLFDEILCTCFNAILNEVEHSQFVDARPTFNEQPSIVNLLMLGILANSALLNEIPNSMIRLINISEGNGVPISCSSLLFTLVKWNTKSKLKVEQIKMVSDLLKEKLKPYTMDVPPEEDSFYCQSNLCVEADKLLEEAITLAGLAKVRVTDPVAEEEGEEED